jgi:hypothetical protein
MAWQGKTGLSEEYKPPASGFPEDARYDFSAFRRGGSPQP